MSTSRRTIGGVTIPDTALVARAMGEARAVSEPYRISPSSDETPDDGVPLRHRTSAAADNLRQLSSGLRRAFRRGLQVANFDRGSSFERPVF
jgi:hypothetical protein